LNLRPPGPEQREVDANLLVWNRLQNSFPRKLHPCTRQANVDSKVAWCYHTQVKPSYDIGLVKGLMVDGSWRITLSAEDTALEMGFDVDDVYDCIVNHLSDTHFYKTMEAEKKPGLMQDVYRITYQDQHVYLKLQICGDVVVVSFKEE
jgi:hypothetical protein